MQHDASCLSFYTTKTPFSIHCCNLHALSQLAASYILPSGFLQLDLNPLKQAQQSLSSFDMAAPQDTTSGDVLDQFLQQERGYRQNFAALEIKDWLVECPRHTNGALSYPDTTTILTDTALLPVCNTCCVNGMGTADVPHDVHIDTCLCATGVANDTHCVACKIMEMQRAKDTAIAARTRISQDGTSTLVCGCGSNVDVQLPAGKLEFVRRCACCRGFQSGKFVNWSGVEIVFSRGQDGVLYRGKTRQEAEALIGNMGHGAPQQPGPDQQPPPPPQPPVPAPPPGSSVQKVVVIPFPMPPPPPQPPTAAQTVQQQRDDAHEFAQQAMTAGNTNTAYLQHPGAVLPIATRKRYLLERRRDEDRANPVNLESMNVHNSLEPLQTMQTTRSGRADQCDVVLTPHEYGNLLTSKRVYQIAHLQPAVQRFVSRVWDDEVRNDEIFAVVWMAIHYGGVDYKVRRP